MERIIKTILVGGGAAGLYVLIKNHNIEMIRLQKILTENIAIILRKTAIETDKNEIYALILENTNIIIQNVSLRQFYIDHTNNIIFTDLRNDHVIANILEEHEDLIF